MFAPAVKSFSVAVCLLSFSTTSGCESDRGASSFEQPTHTWVSSEDSDRVAPGRQVADRMNESTMPSDVPPSPAPLSTTLIDPPYLIASPSGPTDVREAVNGGEPPYTCEIYEGPGEGTIPAGVFQDSGDSSGCVLGGGLEPSWGDHPGNYGFLMDVTDAAGASVVVPVVYEGPGCDTGAVSISPSSAASIITDATRWRIRVADLDLVGMGGGACASCFDVSLLTRSPFNTAPNLDCNASGDFCSPPPELPTSCDQEPTLHDRFIDLRGSTKANGDELGFVTLELSASYSGQAVDPCGSKSWRCHIEVLQGWGATP